MENYLNNTSWQEFAIEDIFSVKIGKNIDANKINKKKGRTAYITRKESNNGVDGFVNHQKELLHTNFPVITIGNETAMPFVQAYPFFTGTKVNILQPKNIVSKHALLFVAQCLKIHKNKYSYSYTINSTRLRKQKILLPTKDGQPDYTFMDIYMRSKEEHLLKTYKNYIDGKVITSQEYTNIPLLTEKSWDTFKIGELFELQQGKSKGLNHLPQSKTGINYLGATRQNNGVLCQVRQVDNIVQKGNCIAFIRNGEGAMGYSIYKAEDFIATSDISVGYNQYLNRYNGIFISTVADRARGKYNFGYKRSGKRLANEKILLPTNSDGQPDYEYMENYMRKKEYEKIKMFLDMKSL